METLSEEGFLRWAAGVGIGFDPRFPESRSLNLLPPRDEARFWILPADPAIWPHLAGSLLSGLDEWDSAYLWPRSGSWPDAGQSRSYTEGVRDVLLRGAGIPAGRRVAVRFSHDEETLLVSVLYAYMTFGWCMDDDLFFVPDHGQQLLQTDHHDVIHVRCASEERVQSLVGHMADAGYQLPGELPDATFKRPAWMDSVEPDSTRDRPRA
jgi:hypothetical protein